MAKSIWERAGLRLFGKAYSRYQVSAFVLSALVLGFSIAAIGVLVIGESPGGIPEQTLFTVDPIVSTYPTHS
jgi:hypothetical protein